MFERKAIYTYKTVIAKVATVAIVNELIKTYLFKINKIKLTVFSENKFNLGNFDKMWLVNNISSLLGFGVSDLFAYKLTENLKLKGNKKQALHDVVRYGTMLFVKLIAMSTYTNKDITTDKILFIFYILIGYVVFDLLFADKQIFTNKKTNFVMFNTGRTIAGVLASDFLVDFDLETNILPTVFSLFVSVPIWGFIILPKIKK